jgi:hypothetical protein
MAGRSEEIDMSKSLAVLVFLVPAFVACQATPPAGTRSWPIPTSSAAAPARTVEPTHPRSAASAPARSVASPMAAAPARPAPVSHAAAPAGSFVRLRGSAEIHLSSCPVVRRALREGILPASAGDGPPCGVCRKSEARATASAPRAAPAVHAPAVRSVAPAADSYVRLRGSPEIHLRSCPLVQRADPAGIVPARAGDGPPCIKCRKAEALSRMR